MVHWALIPLVGAVLPAKLLLLRKLLRKLLRNLLRKNDGLRKRSTSSIFCCVFRIIMSPRRSQPSDLEANDPVVFYSFFHTP